MKPLLKRSRPDFALRPYSSWKLGLNENTNVLIRRYFPKNHDFRIITQGQIDKLIDKLNNPAEASPAFQDTQPGIPRHQPTGSNDELNPHMTIDVAVLLAGGSGRRFRRKGNTNQTNKTMLPIDGQATVLRNALILRDQLDVRTLKIVVCYQHESIRTLFGTGENYGLSIEYLMSDSSDNIADALLRARGKVQGAFYVILADEFYLETNHNSLKSLKPSNWDAVITYFRQSYPHEIAKNYSVAVDECNRVVNLIEKPKVFENDLLGVGTFILKDTIFDRIEEAKNNNRSGHNDLIDIIGRLSKDRDVYGHELTGKYVNVNTIDDWHLSQYLSRESIFPSIKKSLVIPTRNEVDSISFVINDFANYVDEIIIADGGSTDGTIEKIINLNNDKIVLLNGPYSGYGDAIRSGIEIATGDLITLTEADATFRARDLGKLFEFVKVCDMVIGTRTTKQLIAQGANMPFWLRVGNVLGAKFIEMLWISSEPRFTDVGCTFRVFWKDSYKPISQNLSSVGPEFSPEMMIEYIRKGRRVIEIPVSYHERIGGASKHSGSFSTVLKTAFRMLILTLKKRISKHY
jgi:NDP-sugar pyrophosphorylase family protein